MSLFVDTSIWYAAADSSDRSNARSKAILKSGETLVTSDHVLIETWTLLHHELDRKAAERFWEGLRSGIAAIETVTLWRTWRLLGILAFPVVTRVFL
jgi:predicted nucleic acid-binding protein